MFSPQSINRYSFHYIGLNNLSVTTSCAKYIKHLSLAIRLLTY